MAQELLVAICAAMIAVAVLVVGDRIRPKSWRQNSDESSSHLALDLAKTIFTAVLAFVFVACWNQNQNAYNHTITESKGLVDTHLAIHALPAPDRDRIHDKVIAYTDQVLTEEWPLMERERRLSPNTEKTLNSLRAAVIAVQSEDPTVVEARTRALTGIDRVTQARHDRAIDVVRNLPQFLYIALCFGAVLVLLNPVLTGMLVTRRSVAMTALLGVIIGSALLAIHDLERPFSGVLGVPTDAFRYAQSQYEPSSDSPITTAE
ncbi:DUF4239 domain-containing protein [Nocardia sp. XZ_19_369]|uniref:bestrophin-like domain n=1 Tax=Nocardia sp. XZ_19_369 TaxID=2769487 RepID=UPI00188E19E8|nr:DUF4239 domain-containing protein [Nocardia sp. XZ_19_369]